jgi:TonB family protein
MKMFKRCFMFFRQPRLGSATVFLMGMALLPLVGNAQEVVLSKVQKAVAPAYPDVARSNGIEGTVSVRLTIFADGSVRQVERISGDKILFNAANIAAKKWRFDPNSDSKMRTAKLEFRFVIISSRDKSEIGATFLPPFAVEIRDVILTAKDSASSL